MLAEPRRKKKYSINPQGKSWANDDTKIGQKLMEKMGWSKGKGLGANETGEKDNINVTMKFDQKAGLGCSKADVDKWICHQDDFNDLLANLNQANDSPTVNSDSDTKVISLDAASKASKGRLHYTKFSKGKDLSLKKAEELDCIFGRRKSAKLKNDDTAFSQQKETDNKNQESDSIHGANTIKNKSFVGDYYATKMAAMKAKLGLTTSASFANLDGCNDSASKKTDTNGSVAVVTLEAKQETNFSLTTATTAAEVKVENENSSAKKKKKSKKRKNRSEVGLESDTNSKKNDATDIAAEAATNASCDTNIQKSSKKRKRKDEVVAGNDEISAACNVTTADVNETGDNNSCSMAKKSKSSDKKSKKKESKNKVDATVLVNNNNDDVESRLQQDSLASDNVEKPVVADTKPSKKKKKSKRKQNDNDEQVESTEVENVKDNEVDSETSSTRATKKGTKKRKSTSKKSGLSDSNSAQLDTECGFAGSNLGVIKGYAGGLDGMLGWNR